MSRPMVAAVVGVFGFLLYVMAAVALADRIDAQWAAQMVYFMVAGTVWVLPARWLMLWAAHRR